MHGNEVAAGWIEDMVDNWRYRWSMGNWLGNGELPMNLNIRESGRGTGAPAERSYSVRLSCTVLEHWMHIINSYSCLFNLLQNEAPYCDSKNVNDWLHGGKYLKSTVGIELLSWRGFLVVIRVRSTYARTSTCSLQQKWFTRWVTCTIL